MSRMLIIIPASLFCWLSACLIPTIDPYLVIVLALASTSLSTMIVIVSAITIGWWGESIGMAPLGSLIGPLCLTIALLRWAREQLVLKTFWMRTIWFGAASSCYHFFTQWIGDGHLGGIARGFLVIGWHASLGMIGARIVEGALRRAELPRRTTRMSLPSIGGRG